MQIIFCTSRWKPRPDSMLICKDMNFHWRFLKELATSKLVMSSGQFNIMYSQFINIRILFFFKWVTYWGSFHILKWGFHLAVWNISVFHRSVTLNATRYWKAKIANQVQNSIERSLLYRGIICMYNVGSFRYHSLTRRKVWWSHVKRLHIKM